MHSVDETKHRFKKYIAFTEASQPDTMTYPFNLMDDIKVNVISTKRIVDDLVFALQRDTDSKEKTSGSADASTVEVYIY